MIGDPVSLVHPLTWRGHAKVEKFYADDDLRRATPYEVVEAENLLLTAGATLVLNRLCGVTATAVDATNGYLCVGNGTTAAAASQTDLQGASKYRQILDSAPTISGAQAQFVATFGTAVANFDWNEAGMANASSGSTLLNRFVQVFGTKTSSLQWTLTVIVTLA